MTEFIIDPESTEEQWRRIRAKRNYKLEKSDRMMLWDANLTDAQRQAWATYRQALRDLPANTTDPANPVWPTPPQ